MKQVLLRKGSPTVAEVPAPSSAEGRLLVRTAASVVSSGTERASVSSSPGGSLPVRAIRNPELARAAMRSVRETGIRATLDAARKYVGDDIALGYSVAGMVLDTGGVAEFSVGDHVACAGAGYASHAEVVSVPANLAAPVPDGVDPRHAAFTTIGAIALQGVRRASVVLGDRVAVFGLGLLGQLTVQLLRAAGCSVIGVEPVPTRRRLAERLGADLVIAPDEATAVVDEWSGCAGVDASIVTATSTADRIVNDAVRVLRRKGRAVVVGDVGLGLERGPLYEREADLLMSTSYGPGRYDQTYEEGGLDYPIAYVRWTENRNMREFLRLLAAGSVDVESLIDTEISLERAADSYAALRGDDPPLGILLIYPGDSPAHPAQIRRGLKTGRERSKEALGVAIIGAGAFVRGVRLPALADDDRVAVRLVVNRDGVRASNVARGLRDATAATDAEAAFADDAIDLVVIGTRHDSHARLAAQALRAGKAVLCEKPLGLSREEIDEVWAAANANDRFAIGFNRPFAPLSRRMAEELGSAAGSRQLVYRVNAPLQPGHWLDDPRVGGGRILGEGCHMFDYANWLLGSPLRVWASALPTSGGVPATDSASITVEYAGGSIATVHYSAVGAPGMPKERIEVMGGGRSWVLDDFATLTSFDGSHKRSTRSRPPDKGHSALVTQVVDACLGEAVFEPSIEAAYAAQAVAIAALQSISSGEKVTIDLPVRDGASR